VQSDARLRLGALRIVLRIALRPVHRVAGVVGALRLRRAMGHVSQAAGAVWGSGTQAAREHAQRDALAAEAALIAAAMEHVLLVVSVAWVVRWTVSTVLLGLRD